MVQNEILELAKLLIATSEKGLIYSDTPFHVERYSLVKEIGIKLLDIISNIKEKELEKIFIKENGYPTPKLDVRAVVPKGNSLLFVKEKDNGLWSLPGGWIEVGETIKGCIEKEVKEESGYIVTPKRILGVYDRERDKETIPSLFHVLTIYVYCEIQTYEGSAMNDFETVDCGFFDIDNLPELSLDRVSKLNIKKAFERISNQDFITDFE